MSPLCLVFRLVQSTVYIRRSTPRISHVLRKLISAYIMFALTLFPQPGRQESLSGGVVRGPRPPCPPWRTTVWLSLPKPAAGRDGVRHGTRGPITPEFSSGRRRWRRRQRRQWLCGDDGDVGVFGDDSGDGDCGDDGGVGGDGGGDDDGGCRGDISMDTRRRAVEGGRKSIRTGKEIESTGNWIHVADGHARLVQFRNETASPRSSGNMQILPTVSLRVSCCLPITSFWRAGYWKELEFTTIVMNAGCLSVVHRRIIWSPLKYHIKHFIHVYKSIQHSRPYVTSFRILVAGEVQTVSLFCFGDISIYQRDILMGNVFADWGLF